MCQHPALKVNVSRKGVLGAPDCSKFYRYPLLSTNKVVAEKVPYWVEFVNSSSQQNTIYVLIILREAGKQLALIAETSSRRNKIEKLRCAV